MVDGVHEGVRVSKDVQEGVGVAVDDGVLLVVPVFDFVPDKVGVFVVVALREGKFKVGVGEDDVVGVAVPVGEAEEDGVKDADRTEEGVSP